MKKLIFILWLINYSISGFGQITIIQPPIPPVQFSLSNLWNIEVVNLTNNELKGYFDLRLTSQNGGQILLAQSNDVVIGRGNTNFNSFTISEKNRIYFNNPVSNKARQTNLLSFGNFELCVQFIEAGQELASNCQVFSFFPTNPPIGISPVLCEEISGFYPNFIWQEPSPLLEAYQFVYSIKIVEVLKGQTPQAAIQSNIPIHQKENISQTFYQYPADAFPLDSNKKYAWQVKADLEEISGIEGKTSFGKQSLGQSEAECFITPKKELIEKKEEPKFYLIPKKGFNNDYSKISKIIPVSYQEKFQDREIEVFFYDKNKKLLKETIKVSVRRGDNRFEIDLENLGLFKHGEFYWLTIKDLDGQINSIYFLYEE